MCNITIISIIMIMMINIIISISIIVIIITPAMIVFHTPPLVALWYTNMIYLFGKYMFPDKQMTVVYKSDIHLWKYMFPNNGQQYTKVTYCWGEHIPPPRKLAYFEK